MPRPRPLPAGPTMMPGREDRRLTGIAMMIAAYVCFTGIDTSAKWLVLAGLAPLQVVFARYAGHLVIATTLALLRDGRDAFRTRNPRLQALRAACLLASTICNFNAVLYLPLTLTSAIFFTIPLWVCLLSIPLLGERVGPRRWAAILIGFGGILIATRPWTGEAHWAVILSIGAAVLASLYAILTRRLAGVESTASQQFYLALLASLALAPFVVALWQWPSEAIEWLALVLIGFFGWFGHLLMTVAHRFAQATTLAPFVYSQIVFMTAASWIVFASPPDRWVLAGGAVVVASGLYIWLRERQLARPAPPPAKPG